MYVCMHVVIYILIGYCRFRVRVWCVVQGSATTPSPKPTGRFMGIVEVGFEVPTSPPPTALITLPHVLTLAALHLRRTGIPKYSLVFFSSGSLRPKP